MYESAASLLNVVPLAEAFYPIFTYSFLSSFLFDCTCCSSTCSMLYMFKFNTFTWVITSSSKSFALSSSFSKRWAPPAKELIQLESSVTLNWACISLTCSSGACNLCIEAVDVYPMKDLERPPPSFIAEIGLL